MITKLCQLLAGIFGFYQSLQIRNPTHTETIGLPVFLCAFYYGFDQNSFDATKPWTFTAALWITLNVLLISFQTYVCVRLLISISKTLYLSYHEVICRIVKQEIRKEKYLRGAAAVGIPMKPPPLKQISQDGCSGNEAGVKGLSCPAELRNKIYEYALVPGKVHLPPVRTAMRIPVNALRWSGLVNMGAPQDTPRRFIGKHFESFVDTRFATLVRDLIKHFGLKPIVFPFEKPSLGLLGVNKTTYLESSCLYWSRNTFYLPPGPASHTEHYWSSIHLQHKALVKSIGIRMSLIDLTPEVLEHIDYYAHGAPGRNRPGSLRLQDSDWLNWSGYVARVLAFIWGNKLAWLREWHGLEEVRLGTPGEKPLVIRGPCTADRLRRMVAELEAVQPNRQGLDGELRRLLESAIQITQIHAAALIQAKGWESFKDIVYQLSAERL